MGVSRQSEFSFEGYRDRHRDSEREREREREQARTVDFRVVRPRPTWKMQVYRSGWYINGGWIRI